MYTRFLLFILYMLYILYAMYEYTVYTHNIDRLQGMICKYVFSVLYMCIVCIYLYTEL